jgi:hypothetical protein
MANKPIYDGTPGPISGSTPFGFYDNDADFRLDGPKVANYCAIRLGYPMMEVELQDSNFYTCFENAITTYGNEVYLFKIRDNYISLEGSLTGSSLNNTVVNSGLTNLLTIAENYASEAGAGGFTTWYTGSLPLTPNVQGYDLNAWARASASLDTGDSIEIRRIFYEMTPAIVRYFDPYLGSGFNYQGLLETFGWGSYSPAVSYMMFPLYWDIERIQAIELSDYVRRSHSSFELINNQLKIFPIPSAEGGSLKFEYSKRSESINPGKGPTAGLSNRVTNLSNVPYKNPNYSQINSPGRYWIFEYTAALAKEMLAYVRGKYTTVPIPGAEATMNQSDLLADARTEKTTLLEKLRADLDETTRQKQLERKQAESTAIHSTINEIPMFIYIG